MGAVDARWRDLGGPWRDGFIARRLDSLSVHGPDLFAPLTRLLVQFGGGVPELVDLRAVRFKVGNVLASSAPPAFAVVEPLKNSPKRYWFALAALLTGEVEKLLIEHGDRTRHGYLLYQRQI